MSYELFVSKTKVNDAGAVRRVLAGYFCTVTFEVADATEPGAGTLLGGPWQYGPAEPNDFDWPQAVKEELLDRPVPDADAFVALVLDRHGDQGFVDLLRALAPYLASPLTVQAARRFGEGQPIHAREWHVKPGATEVEVNTFKHAVAAEPAG
jgi:hypothetical protein